MDEKQELLEIYKLHAELFDRLGKQRTTTNRFYLVILSLLFGIFIGFLQFAGGLSIVQKMETPRMMIGSCPSFTTMIGDTFKQWETLNGSVALSR